MKQAFHIFRKDARYCGLEIAVLAALTAVWAWTGIRADRDVGAWGRYSNTATLILVLGWWFLISRVAHQESLVGDRQFWITRPYSRGSLLGAKAFFVLAFINTPLLVSGFVMAAAEGHRPLGHLPNLLWMQFTFTSAVLLAPAALASLTRTLVQFVLTVFGLYAGLLALAALTAHPVHSPAFQSSGLAWISGVRPVLAFAVTALVIVLLQLRTRNRLISTGVGAVLFILLSLPDAGLDRRAAAAMEARMFGGESAASMTVALDDGAISWDTKMPDPDGLTLSVPMRIANIPDTRTVAPEILEVRIEAPGGRHWSSGWIAASSSEDHVLQIEPSASGTFTWKQHIVVGRGFREAAATGLLTIRGDVYVMLYSRRSIPLRDNGVTTVPGGAACTVSSDYSPAGWAEATCRRAFHLPFNSSDAPQGTATGPIRLLSVWDSTLPADLGVNPLEVRTSVGRAGDLYFLRYDPRAFVRRSFEAKYVHLR